jgi:hypothetical protein
MTAKKKPVELLFEKGQPFPTARRPSLTIEIFEDRNPEQPMLDSSQRIAQLERQVGILVLALEKAGEDIKTLNASLYQEMIKNERQGRRFKRLVECMSGCALRGPGVGGGYDFQKEMLKELSLDK